MEGAKRNNLIVLVVVVIVVAVMVRAGVYRSRSVQGAPSPAIQGDVRGKQAPDFELNTLDGKAVRLSDYRGKAVLLNFWATWCGPCKIEMPWMVDFEKQYQAQGFEVVGVAMDDSSSADIEKFAKEMGVNYTILRGKEAVGEAYGGVIGLPTSFYIGRDGKIVGQHQGLVSRSDIEENIKLAIAQGAGKP